MRHVPAILGSLVLAAALSVGAWVPARSNADRPSFRFRFDPPAGTEYVQTLLTRRVRSLEGLASQVDRSETRTAIAIEESDDGYLVKTRMLSSVMTRDGNPHDDPITTLFEDLVVTYHVDTEGQIQQVDGLGELQDEVMELLPPEAAERVAPLFTEEALVNREIAEWNGRIGDYAGNTYAIGDSLETELPYTLPSGDTLTYFSKTAFAETLSCPGGTCVRIMTRYDSNADALAKFATTITERVSSIFDETPRETRATEAHVSGAATRVIDPETMLIYREEIARTIQMVVEVEGQGSVPMKIIEERKYSFDYD